MEKCNWLTNELGFDQAVDYKDEKFNEKMAAATPDGVDVYFDNVGGVISYEVMQRMNQFGRISICGSISSYNLDPSQVPKGMLLHRSDQFSSILNEFPRLMSTDFSSSNERLPSEEPTYGGIFGQSMVG